jgi:hypothetical protein
VADPADPVRVEAVDRLIEEQDGGVAQQRRGDAKALPHPERVAPDPAPGDLGETDLFEDLVDPRHRDAVAARRDPQVVARAPARVQVAGFQEGTDMAEWLPERRVRAPR